MAATSKFIEVKKKIFVRVDASDIYRAKISPDHPIFASPHTTITKIVFGNQASIEMQEMALSVKFGGQIDFFCI